MAYTTAPYEVPSTWKALVPKSTDDKCDAFNKAILQGPLRIYQLLKWMFTGTGISHDFRAQIYEPGDIKATARAAGPTGHWLECNFQAVSRPISAGGLVDTYSDLWAAIGTVYGAGDGATTFNVPDLRGRAIVGAGALLANDGVTVGATYAAGTRYGAEDVALTMPELPAEPPPIGVKTDGILINRTSAVTGDVAVTLGAVASDVRIRDNSHADHDDNALGDLGDGEAHENRSPSLCVKYWIAY